MNILHCISWKSFAFFIVVFQFSSLALANEWATGETYQSGSERYQFAPALKAMPKNQVLRLKNIVREKGNVAIVHDPKMPKSNVGVSTEKSVSAQQSDCGNCQVLWNERRKKYAVLLPTVAIRPKNNQEQAVIQKLDAMPLITYRILPIYIEVMVSDMQNWSTVMKELNQLQSLTDFIQPEIIENTVLPE